LIHSSSKEDPSTALSNTASVPHEGGDAGEGTGPAVFTFRVDGMEVGFITHPDRIEVTSVRPSAQLCAQAEVDGDER
jgi:hypothetical protein